MQNLHYIYDPVGNIMDIDQSASAPAGTKLGGPYDNHYIYDKQYRLEQSNGVGTFPYTLNASYSLAGRLGNKSTSAPSLKSDLLFGYNQMHMTHQPRTLFDPQVGTLELYWDANGNLAQMIGCKQNTGRLHEWDEENRLRFVLGERFAGYYGYDANGERVYKLIGISSIGQVNSGSTKAQAIFDDAVLYPNPYVVVTSKGYTKHYYAGTERIATVIGTGGFDDMVTTMDKLSSQHDQDIVKTFYSYYQNYDPFFYQKIVSQPEKTEDISGKTSPDLDYLCTPTELIMVDILNPQDILLKPISVNEQSNGPEKDVYFYHGDHLGSASWITDYTGAPIQYIHYAPYGELIANQQMIGYDERYKFTGKERDAESGYDFFGARYWWLGGTWLSVDQLAGKYPWISPYAYCSWNPIMFIDPDGRDNYRYDHKTGDFVLQEKTNDNFDQIGKYKYNRETGEYEPKYYRSKKDKDEKPIQKFYSVYRNTDGKIAKGILSDGLNIKQSGKTFVLNQTSSTIADYFKFALLLDKVAGVEISGYTYNNKVVHFDSYKNNSYNRSNTNTFTFPEGYQNIQHFHTHGHAGYSEAIQPSENYDIPFKNQMISNNPGKDILFLILHNYGAPIKY